MYLSTLTYDLRCARPPHRRSPCARSSGVNSLPKSSASKTGRSRSPSPRRESDPATRPLDGSRSTHLAVSTGDGSLGQEGARYRLLPPGSARACMLRGGAVSLPDAGLHSSSLTCPSSAISSRSHDARLGVLRRLHHHHDRSSGPSVRRTLSAWTGRDRLPSEMATNENRPDRHAPTSYFARSCVVAQKSPGMGRCGCGTRGRARSQGRSTKEADGCTPCPSPMTVRVSRLPASMVSSGSSPILGFEVAQLHGQEGRVFALAFTPDDAELVSTSLDGTLRIWQAPEHHGVKSMAASLKKL